MLILQGQPFLVAIGIAVLFGLVIGVLEALIISYWGVPAIVGSLGMMFIIPAYETAGIIKLAGGSKIVWGTDGPFADYEWEKLKIERVARSSEEYEKIIGATMKDLLRLDG